MASEQGRAGDRMRHSMAGTRPAKAPDLWGKIGPAVEGINLTIQGLGR
jgi:hypothetical protein